MPVDSPVQLVLHICEKIPCRDGIPAVIDTRRVDIGNLLVEFPLRHPDFPDFFEQVLKVFFVKNLAVFQALFVENITLYREIAQNVGRPLPELRCADRIHAVSHRNYRIEIVEFGL